MVRVEDIVFWILITSIIGISIWLAFGSPLFESSLIAIMIFVATSEILLWKTLFSFDIKNADRIHTIENKTSLGFEKVRSDIRDVNTKLSNIEKDISEIKNTIIK